MTRSCYVQHEHPSELLLFGSGSLEALDRPDHCGAVASVNIRFVTVEAAMAGGGQLAKLEKLRSLSFGRNQIFSMHQLDALRHLPCLTSITVSENPICGLRSALRTQALRLFPDLHDFNGRELADSEREAAAQIFRSLDNLSKKATPFCLPGCSESRTERVPDLHSDQVSAIVEGVVTDAVAVSEKTCAVHDCFESAVHDAMVEAWEEALVLEDAAFDRIGASGEEH